MRVAIGLAIGILGLVVLFWPDRDHNTVGIVQFDNSGSKAAQAPFHRGLALLHNFEYEDAAEAFQEAQRIDPDFAMAYWGEAMTHTHPIWFEQDAEAAKAVLQKLGATPPDRRAKAPTAREKAYLDAIEILYGDGGKIERDFAYSSAMKSVHEAYPGDVDARAFYAVSLLGLAHNGRDIPLYIRAAALLEEVFPENKSHPGVLHYLIHSYDDPTHAHLGLRAARLYSDIAPDAAHAQHMTSHIFVARGMWDEVIAANLQAEAVSARQRQAAGRLPNDCGHYSEWLIYGYLQTGNFNEAAAKIHSCRRTADKELTDEPRTAALEDYFSDVYSHTDMALRYWIDTGEPVDRGWVEVPDGRYLWSQFFQTYGDALAAREQADALERLSARLDAIRTAIELAIETDDRTNLNGDPLYRIDSLTVMQKQIKGLLALAHEQEEEGLTLLRQAAEQEASLPLDFGPPTPPKPSHELLGDELAALDRADEAEIAYRQALKRTPGRRLQVERLKRQRPGVQREALLTIDPNILNGFDLGAHICRPARPS